MRGRKAEIQVQGGCARGRNANEESRRGQGWTGKDEADAREGNLGLGLSDKGEDRH